jgi:hypothetical protein
VALTHDQIDGWSIVIGVAITGSRWSCNDGGESHGGLDVLMEAGLFEDFVAMMGHDACGRAGFGQGQAAAWRFLSRIQMQMSWPKGDTAVGDPKIGWSPRTQEPRAQVTRAAKGRRRISKSLYSPQKLWILIHVPSRHLL